ncbi:glycosyltransferase [Luteitalea sp.]|uniref:glycosyltransferase n=1 Tax=Luteitalea sp. TaxID=2004800 RepID=UPI0037C9814D
MTSPATPLRILMLAPEPFFEPRGTPFSEYHRIKALVEDGHHVDLVTYPVGRDVDLPNLRIIRSWRPPFIRKVPIGPSLTKIVLDAFLSLTILRVAFWGGQRYDAIHSHEEMGVLGVWLGRRLKVPHLYDMHSSLPQQLGNFRYSRSRALRWGFEQAEGYMVRGSQVVITICQELQDTVHEMGVGERAVLIENVMGGDVDPAPGPGREAIRGTWGLSPTQPVALYTGTFEQYQGLDLLLDASVALKARVPDAVVLVVGGAPEQVAALQARATAAGAPLVLTGQRPPAEIPHFVDAADVLVSPRISGTNTPLKIYSYLRSGRPIVATNLRTHTQVLTPESAVLVDPTAAALADGLARVLGDRQEAARVAAGAQRLADERYSRESYLTRTRRAYAMLLASMRGAGAVPVTGAAPSAGQEPR